MGAQGNMTTDDPDDDQITCWCGATGTYDELFDSDLFRRSCGGTETGGGTIYRFRCSKCESVSDWLLLTDDELVKGVACRECEATNA
jgi:hypothetical protein